MKIIFLDVDGVLNYSTFLKMKGSRTSLASSCVENLDYICKMTGAKCVLSSTWRRGWPIAAFQQLLEEYGFTGSVIDRTPYLSGQERGVEIAMYLEDCKNRGYLIKSFVILDDDSDMGPLKPFLVQTSWQAGLEEKHVKRAIEMLGKL